MCKYVFVQELQHLFRCPGKFLVKSSVEATFIAEKQKGKVRSGTKRRIVQSFHANAFVLANAGSG